MLTLFPFLRVKCATALKKATSTRFNNAPEQT